MLCKWRQFSGYEMSLHLIISSATVNFRKYSGNWLFQFWKGQTATSVHCPIYLTIYLLQSTCTSVLLVSLDLQARLSVLWWGYLGWERAKSFAQMGGLSVCVQELQPADSIAASFSYQGHPWECLTGSISSTESLIEHFRFANKGDILCLLSPVKLIMTAWCITQLTDICLWLQCWSLARWLCVRPSFQPDSALAHRYNLQWVGSFCVPWARLCNMRPVILLSFCKVLSDWGEDRLSNSTACK